MIADAFVIRLPDGTLHYARPGHVNALCGANRVTNGDRWTGTVEDVCPACVLLRGEEEPRVPMVEVGVSWSDAMTVDSTPLDDSGSTMMSALRAKTEPERFVECPDCGALWAILSGEPCPGCNLAEEDVEAGADFWVALGAGEL